MVGWPILAGLVLGLAAGLGAQAAGGLAAPVRVLADGKPIDVDYGHAHRAATRGGRQAESRAWGQTPFPRGQTPFPLGSDPRARDPAACLPGEASSRLRSRACPGR
jgi:hypothetical protein